MSYNFEKIFTINVVCYKCHKLMKRSQTREEVIIGALFLECPGCHIKVIISEGDIRID